MDSDSKTVCDFLAAMQQVRDALGALIPLLYQRSEVKLVSAHGPEVVPSPDLGVSAELKNGACVDFWIYLDEECGWIEYGLVPGGLAELPEPEQRQRRRYYRTLNPAISWVRRTRTLGLARHGPDTLLYR